MRFRVEISVNQMEKYKKMRNYKREHLLHIDKDKRAQKEHEIWTMISSNVDPGFCRKYGNICYNWRIKNSI